MCVVWFTELPSASVHWVLVGDGVTSLKASSFDVGKLPDGVWAVKATTSTLSRTAEDSKSQIENPPAESEGIVRRVIRRHEAKVAGLTVARHKYRVVSVSDGEVALSAVYTLAPALPAGVGARIMLTSDHQAMQNTATNLQLAAQTMGALDAVLVAGDLVNIPDRASEWFDDTRSSAFFRVLQGTASRVDRGGVVGKGAAIVQNTPMFPAIGNHEVQGRIDGVAALNTSFNAPVPREVATEAYEARGLKLSDSDKERWIENNSFSTRTYEEVFTLPDSGSGHSRWYATTVGNTRIITLYSTRIWRWIDNNADPAERKANSRYQEAAQHLDDPLAQGYGDFIFETLAKGSPQYEWLKAELFSPERKAYAYTIVQLHEGPHGLGDNVNPVFSDPERIEERDASGNLVGVRYEYEQSRNALVTDLAPLLEDAGVQLVLNGHSHLWNRFTAANGVTHYMEGSNTGNTYGAYTTRNGKRRHVPDAPWKSENYPVFDNPGGLQPEVPNLAPESFTEGDPMPYLSDNFQMAFQIFDSGTGELSSWRAPVGATLQKVTLFDKVTLVPNEVVPLPTKPEPEQPGKEGTRCAPTQRPGLPDTGN